jgi:photosystem II stability/assembly factor-like uncharacterized protein
MKTRIVILMAAAFCGWFTMINPVFAQTWTQTSAPGASWTSIAASADGTKLVAANYPNLIYTSTDSGMTWTSNNVPDEWWYSMASSADGTKLVAVVNGGGIFTSTNSGRTWMQTSAPSSVFSYWFSVASSADGTKLIASGGPGVYISENSGTTWVSNNVPSGSVATSADGVRLVVVGSGIYTSTNSGTTWVTNNAPSLGSTQGWSAIASSADGTKLVAGVSGNGYRGPIYTSTNSGITWISNNAPLAYWDSLASSADGSKLIAAGSAGVFLSANYGINWVSNAPYAYGVASSADGGKLIAMMPATPGVGIYVSQSIRAPQLNATSSTTNLIVSWIVPSTNFVMQHSADLQNWADMTNQPVLNLTNLQNEMILPLAGSNAFYRLNTQ